MAMLNNQMVYRYNWVYEVAEVTPRNYFFGVDLGQSCRFDARMPCASQWLSNHDRFSSPNYVWKCPNYSELTLWLFNIAMGK